MKVMMVRAMILIVNQTKKDKIKSIMEIMGVEILIVVHLASKYLPKTEMLENRKKAICIWMISAWSLALNLTYSLLQSKK